MPPALVVVIHRFEPNGGQELSTWEVMLRLGRAGFAIEVWAFTAAPLPAASNIKVHLVPGGGLPSQMLRSLWFMVYTWLRWRVSRYQSAKYLTLGTAFAPADIRVIQFVNASYAKLVERGLVPLPNARGPLQVFYQRAYLSYNLWAEKRWFASTARLIAISARVAGELEGELKCSRDAIAVIHHGAAVIPAVQSAIRSQSRLRHKKRRLLFVGALERKGIAKALAALAQVKDFDWHFDVVGEGHIRHWQAEVERLGLGGRISFHGAKPAGAFFSSAEVFLFPSYYEPFGLVVSEAAQAGLALLCSEECGAMELWQGVPEWLRLSAFSPVADWVQALRRILSNETDFLAACPEAFEPLRQRSWDLVAEGYAAVLKQELGGALEGKA